MPAPSERSRPARGGIRLPRSLREYTAVDTTTLRSLVHEALEAGSPPPARQAYARLLLAHAAPQGRHLLRAIRAGERHASANELTEFRCAVRMNDRAVIAFRNGTNEDDYLRARSHQRALPDCLLCEYTPPA